MSTTTTNIDNLYVDAIDVKPQAFSWEPSLMEGFAEDPDGVTWKFWEAVEPDDGDTADCARCGESIIYTDNEWFHSAELGDLVGEDAYDHEPEPDYENRRDKGSEGPMMSYWYPVEIRDPEQAAKLIVDLPLCVVEVDGETGLALTGGGMDLSREICAAYVRLGHYPPFHYAANLPKMAERLTDEMRTVFGAARESCRIMRGWAERGMERVDETLAWYEERENAS